jgi:hypothetical protein
MLDTYRAEANKLEIKLAPTDLLKDVLEPVCNMLYQRDGGVVTVDCPKNLITRMPKTDHAEPWSQLNQVCSFRFSVPSSCC